MPRNSITARQPPSARFQLCTTPPGCVKAVKLRGGIKKSKPRRRSPGMAALREIRWEQNKTGVAFAMAPFKQVVRDLIQEIILEREEDGWRSHLDPSETRVKKTAFAALAFAAQDVMIQIFKKATTMAIHAGRQTIQVNDIILALPDIPAFSALLKK